MAKPRKPRSGDPWPQRLRFLDLLDAKVGSGTPIEEIAQALGLRTTKSLEFSYRHDFSRMPARTTLEKAADYFGVPLWEIYGPHPPKGDGDEMALAKAAILDAMGSDIVATLTDEQILNAYRVAMATARAMLSQK